MATQIMPLELNPPTSNPMFTVMQATKGTVWI
jgi:hypothetical protein